MKRSATTSIATSRSSGKKARLDAASAERSSDKSKLDSTISDSIGTGTLKQLKRSLRALIVALQAIECERVVLDRMWYKNASQFQSALWWRHANSLRRCLRSLDTARALTARIALVYAELCGADQPGSNQGLASVAARSQINTTKHRCRPQISADKAETQAAEGELQELKAVIEVVRKRAEKGAKVLMVHLNTPPAPTFAPLVSALIAICAAGHHPTAALAGEESALDELRNILAQLRTSV
ncbi:hypothetical protein L1887_53219 [Cichorium endivia]|nr:hypothetical protein L1887_53219 [Cichorium endivia]